MFLIGQNNHKEPLNVKVFQDIISRFFIKLEKHALSLAQNAKGEPETLGYDFTFKDQFKQKTKLNDALLTVAVIEDLKEFFEPFRRKKNSLANINQALRDLTTLALTNSSSEKLADFCLNNFKSEYNEDLENAGDSGKKSIQLIENLLEFSRLAYDISAKPMAGRTRSELVEKNAEILNGFKSILNSMRDHDAQKPTGNIVPFPKRSADGPA